MIFSLQNARLPNYKDYSKRARTTLPINYWPISLHPLPLISKLIEKRIHDQPLAFLENYNLRDKKLHENVL